MRKLLSVPFRLVSFEAMRVLKTKPRVGVRIGCGLAVAGYAAYCLVLPASGAPGCDPASGNQCITDIALPSDSAPYGITIGPDNMVWYADSGRDLIGKFNPANNQRTEFPIPPPRSGPVEIVVGPDANLWFTEFNGDRIGRITPSGAMTEWLLPFGSRPYGICVGPDGNIWFAEQGSNDAQGQIGRITPGGTITEFGIGDDGSLLLDIIAAPDGNLWFTMLDKNAIGRITPHGQLLPRFPAGPGRTPFTLAVGPDHKIWYSTLLRAYDHYINKMSLDGSVENYHVTDAQHPESEPTSFVSGPDGYLWFLDRRSATSGRARIVALNSNGTVAFQKDIPSANSGFSNVDPRGLVFDSSGDIWFSKLVGRLGKLNLGALPAAPAITSIAPDSGPTAGGTKVVISGTNLGSNPVVNFAGSTIYCTSDSEVPCKSATVGPNTTWEVTSPVHTARPAQVRLSTPTGSSDKSFLFRPPVISAISPTEGPVTGGTLVTVTGTDLHGSSLKLDTVSLDSSAFTVNPDGNRIVLTTPPKATGRAQVTAVTPSTDSALAPSAFAYLPVVSAISPPSGKTAGGDQITIYGRGFTGATTVTFGNEPSITIPAARKDDEIVVTTPSHDLEEAVTVRVSGYPGGPASGMETIASEVGSNLFTYKNRAATVNAPPTKSSGAGNEEPSPAQPSTPTGSGTSPGFSTTKAFAPGSGFITSAQTSAAPTSAFTQSEAAGASIVPGTSTVSPGSPVPTATAVQSPESVLVSQPGHQGVTVGAASIAETLHDPAPEYRMVARAENPVTPWALSMGVGMIIFLGCCMALQGPSPKSNSAAPKAAW